MAIWQKAEGFNSASRCHSDNLFYVRSFCGQYTGLSFLNWVCQGQRTFPSAFFHSGPGRVFFDWSLRSGRQTIAVINLPAGLVQLPTVFLRADRREWMPPGVDFQACRAVTWP